MRLHWNKYGMMCFLSAALVLCGCEKEPEKGTGAPIAFGLGGLEVSTKAALTQSDFDSGSQTVYVHAKKNNTQLVFSSLIVPVSRQASGLWYPSGTRVDWASGTYTFRGMASSIPSMTTVPSASLNYESDVDTPGIAVFNSGMSIKVNQPTTYDESQMVDYLLSRTFNVSDGNSKPIVTLLMEHAMPAVEIYIVKSKFLNGACLDSLTLKGVYSSGTMVCSKLCSYGEAASETHLWSTTPSDNDNVYLLSGTLADQITIGDDRASTKAYMKLILMPQQLTPDAVLQVRYWVNERASNLAPDNYVRYTEDFQLFNFTPQTWSPAHRIIYTLVVDTGIHLVGTIVPWKDVDFIEGTILPEV